MPQWKFWPPVAPQALAPQVLAPQMAPLVTWRRVDFILEESSHAHFLKSTRMRTSAIMLLVAFVVVVCLLFFLLRRPLAHGSSKPAQVREPIQDLLAQPDRIVYGVKNLRTPLLAGWKFRTMIALSFTRLGKMTIVPGIIKASGLDLMSYLYLPEKPSVRPNIPAPPSPAPRGRSNEAVIRRLMEKRPARAAEASAGASASAGFAFASVADFEKAYRAGGATPTSVAEAILAGIMASDKARPPLRAFVDWDRDEVLRMAEESTKRWQSGKPLSLLDGVPVAIKGEFRVEPYRLLSGCTFVPTAAQCTPEYVMVQRLRDAGAMVVGVTNMQEIGMGTLGSNPNPFHLTPRNPYDPRCYTGGSSAGSAAAVAAGFCPIAFGSDGGGSVRIPAALCGVVGLKPTYGAFDNTGLLPLSFTVGMAGPLCSSMLDLAISLDLMSRKKTKGEEEGGEGEGEGEGRTVSLEGVGEERLDGLRVGVYWDFFNDAEEEVVRVCRGAVGRLEALGAAVVEVKIPELEETRVAHALTIMAETCTSMLPDMEPHFSDINLESLMVLSAGFQFSAVEYVNAQKQRTRAVEAMKHVFRSVDVLVMPATGCVAPTIPKEALSQGASIGTASGDVMRFSFLGNLTGLPGLVLPVGYSRGGGGGGSLPIGLQVMGPWYQEALLLKVGWAMEASGFFPLQRPGVHYQVLEGNL